MKTRVFDCLTLKKTRKIYGQKRSDYCSFFAALVIFCRLRPAFPISKGGGKSALSPEAKSPVDRKCDWLRTPLILADTELKGFIGGKCESLGIGRQVLRTPAQPGI